MKTRSKQSRHDTGSGTARDAQSATHTARKRFGQHFLEQAWVAKLLAHIAPRPHDCFIEIGAGSGQLTIPLAETGATIVGIEIDRDLVKELESTVPRSVRIVSGDVLEQDLLALIRESFGPATTSVRIVGNLPYNLSSPILAQLFGVQLAHGCFADATLMLQREVAERVVGRPGSRAYGPLAILTEVTAEAEQVLSLPPGAFRPPPRVRSALTRLAFRPSPVEIGDPTRFAHMVRCIFTQRRKTILNALTPCATPLAANDVRVILEEAGLNIDRRPATLHLRELAKLAQGLARATERIRTE